MKTQHLLTVLCLSAAMLSAEPALAKQWGITVGIDTYPKLPKNKQLRGAVNDAQLLAATLRKRGVDLPDSRLLLNENATAERFKAAWQDVLKTAKPGEEIIVTFAGHGGQQAEFGEPRDEADQKDETLMFYDYDPDFLRGRIADDELYALFEKAAAYRILFVADTCHSGGLTRSALAASGLPTRGGVLDNVTFNYAPHDYQNPGSDDSQLLAHVTYLAAAGDESKTIPEINTADDRQWHGALSWSFAKAFEGAADQDRNTVISRLELEQYVKDQVQRLTNWAQEPGMRPRGTDSAAFSLADSVPLAAQAGDDGLPPVPVNVSGGAVPTGVKNLRLDDSAYQLQIVIADGQATVFNPQHDRLTAFPAVNIAAWNKIIAKYRLLTALDAHYNSAEKPLQITLEQGNRLHRLHERLNFSFDPNSEKRYFALFDLAGSGELQFLYPVAGENPKLTKIPYRLPLEVVPPTGADDLVAVFCATAPEKMTALLNDYHGKNPPAAEDFLATLGRDCQIGRYAFFTEG